MSTVYSRAVGKEFSNVYIERKYQARKPTDVTYNLAYTDTV